MNGDYISILRTVLPAAGIELAPGLSESALKEIEQAFGFSFPPDLRLLLSSFVPRGDDFPDWHHPHEQDLVEWFDMPADGIEFDVEENGYWQDAWGARPEDPDDAVEEARRRVALAPILIPLHSNRFVSAQPAESANPVLAVMQTEVVTCAPDVGWYFHDEFGAPEPSWPRGTARPVEFWSSLRS